MTRRPSRRPGLKGRFAVLAVISVAALLVLRFLLADDGYPALLALRTDLARIEADLEHLQQQNAVLRQNIHALRHDPSAVEKIAREELDFSLPGEWVYLFPADLPEKPAGESPSERSPGEK
ncbi:MAG: septum formation initiator family protein [Acidobacteriota bacterium]